MQELVYTNLYGERVRFSGDPQPNPFVFEKISGTEGAAITRKTTKGALQNGERTVSALLQDRRVTLQYHMFAASREELAQLRVWLSGVLSAAKGFDPATGRRGKITYTDDFGTWWTWAVPTKRSPWPKRVQNIYPSLKSLTFDCDSPYWYAQWQSSGKFDIKGGGFELPYEYPIEYATRAGECVLYNKGQTHAPLQITLYGQGEKPTVVNRTTGKRLQLHKAFPEGAVLRISTDPDDLYVRAEMNGAITNAYGYLDVATPVSAFTLAPGRNVMDYVAGGATGKTEIEFRWWDRLEGV